MTQTEAEKICHRSSHAAVFFYDISPRRVLPSTPCLSTTPTITLRTKFPRKRLTADIVFMTSFQRWSFMLLTRTYSLKLIAPWQNLSIPASSISRLKRPVSWPGMQGRNDTKRTEELLLPVSTIVWTSREKRAEAHRQPLCETIMPSRKLLSAQADILCKT